MKNIPILPAMLCIVLGISAGDETCEYSDSGFMPG